MTNHKIQITKQIQMNNDKYQNQLFDLEDRTLHFAKNCIDLTKMIMRDAVNIELINRLIRESSSVGANYREANDSLAKKEFYHRIGISRRESKESKCWLELLAHSNTKYTEKITPLIDEALQLLKIFSAIVQKESKAKT